MHEVAIIGAGDMGGALAHALARSRVAGSIRLIDATGRIAEGKALDIAQAAPVEGFATQLSGSTDSIDVAGAAVVVIADRALGAEWQGDEGLMLVTRVLQLAPRAIIVCAGASQRELVDLGVRERHASRPRIVGSAPEALSAAVRALVALDRDASAADVALSVVGVPPERMVISWEDATLGGFALTRLIDEPARRRIAARVAALWPPGPLALAAAATKVVECVLGRSRRATSCFVAPDDGAGSRLRTAALPVRLGPAGVEAVILPPLSAAERVALDNAMML